METLFHYLPCCSPKQQTLRHALQVTRCLDFRYLWIDALCMNQEDEQDKQHEISFMGEIYAGSELNIAATAASSESDGLFHERNSMEVDINALDNGNSSLNQSLL